jgi:predicted NUDIX family NTP pyrophosphohydrolase
MSKLSAGLLLVRRTRGAEPEVLLVHPGGPFWARRDLGAWSIPKGEHRGDDDRLAAARREFSEELGAPAPDGPMVPLSPVRQAGGKVVSAWAVEADLDSTSITSNSFEIEWPKGSGQMRTYPEVDRAEWFSISEARMRILAGQVPLLDELTELLALAVKK